MAYLQTRETTFTQESVCVDWDRKEGCLNVTVEDVCNGHYVLTVEHETNT